MHASPRPCCTPPPTRHRLGVEAHPAHRRSRRIAGGSAWPPRSHPVGELFQRERQQRQGVAAAGIGDQTSDQIILEAQPGYLGGLFDDLAQRVGRQGPNGLYPRRQFREVSVFGSGIEEFRAASWPAPERDRPAPARSSRRTRRVRAGSVWVSSSSNWSMTISSLHWLSAPRRDQQIGRDRLQPMR